MKYEEVFRKIGGFGPYQKVALCLFGIPTLFDAMTSMMLVFVLGSHGHRCQLPDIVDNVYSNFHSSNYNTSDASGYSTGHHNNTVDISGYNSSLSKYSTSQCHLNYNGTQMACNDWVFDASVYRTTLISKFNMVCEDKFMRSHVLLSHFVGTLFNALTCGFMCDIFGRKPVLMVGILLLIIPNFIRPWISSLYIVMFCEFLNATGSNLAYVVPFTLVTEIVDPAHRVLANFAIYFSYCMGSLLLLLYAYFIRDWETLIMVISGPIIITFFIFTFVTESPRWLLLKGRTKEALKIFKKTARFNNRSVDFIIEEIEIKREIRQSLCRGLQCMFRSKQLIVRFFILLFNWFACSMIYYGISMNTGDLGGNVYINYAVSTIVETFAVVLCYYLTERFPRKSIYCPAMIVGGVACLCTIFTSLYGNESIHWITIALAMIGKLGVTTAFFIIYLITSEVFPMVIRASLFSLCSTGARIGSMTSSYIGKFGVLIDSSFGTALPLVIFGCIGTVAGLLSLLLPETRNTNLPETFEDAVNMKSDQEQYPDGNRSAEKLHMLSTTRS